VQSILKFGVYCPEGEHLTKPVLSANPAAPAVKREAVEEGEAKVEMTNEKPWRIAYQKDVNPVLDYLFGEQER